MPNVNKPQSYKITQLSIVFTALIFGSISCSFYYIAFGVLANFSVEVLKIAMPLLLMAVGFLFPVFVFESNIERSLKERFNNIFKPIFIALIFVALVVEYYILGRLANFTWLASIEYWFYLVCFLGVSIFVALCVLFFAPKTRLENYICCQLSECSKFYLIYQVSSYVFLITIFIIAVCVLYEYYLYVQPPIY
jgi:hypothetical protein